MWRILSNYEPNAAEISRHACCISFCLPRCSRRKERWQAISMLCIQKYIWEVKNSGASNFKISTTKYNVKLILKFLYKSSLHHGKSCKRENFPPEFQCYTHLKYTGKKNPAENFSDRKLNPTQHSDGLYWKYMWRLKIFRPKMSNIVPFGKNIRPGSFCLYISNG